MTQPSRASLAVLVTSVVVFIVSGGPLAVAQGPDLGLPIYPGATKDPEFPPLKTPFMQNLHLLSGDPFDKIVTWYTEKLGKFTRTSSKKGQQALWDDKTPEGRVRTVTISTINAPAGKVKITLTSGMLR